MNELYFLMDARGATLLLQRFAEIRVLKKVSDISIERLQMERIKKEKPLLRRKSELPHDTYTVKALTDHRRADEYLSTPPDVDKC